MATIFSNKCGWAIALLTLLNLGVIGFSLLRRPPHPPHPRELSGLWAKELNLTTAQEARFKTIEQEQMRVGQQLSEQMNGLKRKMVELSVRAPQDSMALDSIFQASDEVHRALNRHKINYYERLRLACNPDQQERLKAVFLQITQRGPEPPGSR